MKKILFLFIFLFSFVVNDLNATHAAGLEITYTCDTTNPNSYIISVSFYRDCDGISAPSSFVINVASASCGQSFTQTLFPIPNTGQDITPICPGYQTQCTGGTFPGIEEWVYEGVITLPLQCNDWIISTDECCRNNAITNINNPGAENIYVETLINNTAGVGCNNSPEFTNPPVSFICANQLYCYNNGALDLEGDSLVYEPITPMTAAFGAVVYGNSPGGVPYTPANPFDGVTTFDSTNGNLCVTPAAPQVTVIAVRISEYRNGVLIGSVIRDIQVNVIACSNNIPNLSGMDGLPINSFNTDTIVCPGELLTFDILSADNDSADNLTIIWNNGIPAATFTPNNNGTGGAYGSFSWTPTVNDSGSVPHCFTVTVADDHCPINALFTYSYCITVGGNPVDLPTYPQTCVGGAPFVLTGGHPAGGTYSGPGVVNDVFYPSDAGSGSHTITYNVSSNLGCSGQSSTNIIVNNTPSAGQDGNITLCTGDPSVDLFNYLNGSYDSGGYWEDPSGNVVSNILDPSSSLQGTYSYVVPGIPPCSDDIANVVVALNSYNFSTNSSDISCAGFTDGQIEVIINTGVFPYQYSIDGGNTYQYSNIFSNLNPGVYDVVVQDGVGCSVIQTVTIDSPPDPIQVVASSSDAACFDDPLGSASVDYIVGGTPYTSGYDYTWYHSGTNLPVGSSSDLNDVNFGGYYVVASDSLGCTGSSTVTIDQPNAFTYNVNQLNPLCHGDNGGSIFVNITGGGVAPYSFDWQTLNPADTLQSLYNLVAGNYTLNITDSQGCDTTLSFDIITPGPMSVQASVINHVDCYGDATGSATVAVSGGQTPYTYIWSSGHASDTANNLFSGFYTVTVTDANGCVIEDNVTINENSPITSTVNSNAVSCNGGSNGLAVVNASGGVSPYVYNWSSGSTNSSISGLSYGEYWVVIADDLGCIHLDTAFITEPQAISVSLQSTDITCVGFNDGILTGSAFGGTSPYNYNLSFGGNNIYTDTSSFVLSGLSEGSYTVFVQDVNGCIGVGYSNISSPDPLSIIVGNIDTAYCVNVNTGSASVFVTGGTLATGSNYSYSWDGSNVDTLSILSHQEAGIYNVQVTDDNGCQTNLNIDIPLVSTFNIDDIATTDLTCYNYQDGIATVSVSGGFAPYSYDWSLPNGNNANTNSSNPSYSFSGISEGSFSVTVTDGNGCVITDWDSIVSPPEFVFYINKTQDQSCYGEMSSCDGVLAFTIAGGNNPYNINWYDLQNTMLGSQNNIINSFYNLENICSGYYYFEVLDDNGCAAMLSVDSDDPNPVEILQGLQVDASINLSSVSSSNLCFGDSLGSASVLNPNPLFVYDWYQNNNILFSNLTNVNGLPGGDIYVTATYVDSSNNICSTSSSLVNIYQPAELILSMSSDNVDCFGNSSGFANVDITGGVAPYAEDWGNANPNTLSAGSYNVDVTDANGCNSSASVTISEPTELQSSIDITSNMDMSANTTGGISPYTYSWSFNNNQLSTSSSLTPSQNGIYTLLVYDANGCTSVSTYNYTLISVDNSLDVGVSIYPNPFSDKLYIELEGITAGLDYVVKMYDARGRLVVEKGINSNITIIDRKGINKGLYFVEIVGLDVFKMIQVD